jgi:hypothetical protein
MSNEVSDEVRVKNEPICDSQSISQTKKAMKVKEEPKDIEMQTSKSHIEDVKNTYKVFLHCELVDEFLENMGV